MMRIVPALRRLTDEALGGRVELDLGGAQLGRAQDPGDERDDDDRGDEERRDLASRSGRSTMLTTVV